MLIMLWIIINSDNVSCFNACPEIQDFMKWDNSGMVNNREIGGKWKQNIIPRLVHSMMASQRHPH